MPAFRLRARPAILLALSSPTLAHGQSAATDATSVLQMVLGLVVVLALLVGGLHVLKRLSAPRGAASGLLKVLGAAAVGPRERVVLVEVADSWVVVGVSPGHIAALHTLPRQPVPAAEQSGAGSTAREFADRLRQLVERSRNAQQKT